MLERNDANGVLKILGQVEQASSLQRGTAAVSKVTKQSGQPANRAATRPHVHTVANAAERITRNKIALSVSVSSRKRLRRCEIKSNAADSVITKQRQLHQ